jgi:hypothetical protein
MGVEPSSRTRWPSIGRHLPHQPHDLYSPSHQLDDLEIAIWLSALRMHRHDPARPGVVDTRRGDEQVLSLLDPHRFSINQPVERLPPKALIHIDPQIGQPNLALLADLACALAEPEDPPEAAGLDQAALGIPEHHLWRPIIPPSLVIRPCVCPRPPELIGPHERRLLPIARLPSRAPRDIGLQHPALDRTAPCGEVLPGMPPGHRGPVDAERLEPGAQGEKYPGMVADHRVRRAPLGHGLAAHWHHPGEVLAIEAPSAHEGPAVAVAQQDALEPVSVDVGQIPHIHEPHWVGRRGLPRTLVGMRQACWPRRQRMGLLVERDHLPDRGVAIAIAQRVEGQLHPVVPQEGMVLQPLEDLPQHLNRHAGGDGGPRPRPGGHAQQP